MIPMENSEEREMYVKNVCLFLEMREIPVSIEDIGKDIKKEQLLLKVIKMVRYGRLHLLVGEAYKPHLRRRFELSDESKC